MQTFYHEPYYNQSYDVLKVTDSNFCYDKFTLKKNYFIEV